MARIRTIKPGFFKNEDLAEIDPYGRLLFAGLWCLADREGRLEDRPRRIRAEIFPFDNVDIEHLLDELADRGFILRYSVDQQHFIQVTNFSAHQTPHYKEPPSVLPSPPGHIDSGVLVGAVHATLRARILERDGHHCVRCGSSENLSIDHVIPRAKGGSNDEDNLQVRCRRCNSQKGSRIENPSLTQHQGNDGPSLRQPDRELEHGILDPENGILDLENGILDPDPEERDPEQQLAAAGAAAATPAAAAAGEAEPPPAVLAAWDEYADGEADRCEIPARKRPAYRAAIRKRLSEEWRKTGNARPWEVDSRDEAPLEVEGGNKHPPPAARANDTVNGRLAPASPDDRALWQQTLELLRGDLSRINLEAWLAPAQLLGQEEDGRLVVGAPNKAAVEWINANCLSLVAHRLGELLGRDCQIHCEVHKR